MLLFRSEEHIDRWCRAWRFSRGAALSLDVAWKLATAWYDDRLSADWRRRTADESQSLFASLGFTSDFWRLS